MTHAQQSDAARPSLYRASASTKWPDWNGATAVLVATGPSLTAEDVALVRDNAKHLRVIAINEAGLPQYAPLAAPFADILYAADRAWWQHYRPTRPDYQRHVSGEVVEGVETIALTMLERGQPMPREPGAVVSGGHSGFQALGLALTLGAARILLLGFDCGGGPARNCHADRPAQFKRQVNMRAWADFYNTVPREWPHVEVVNCGQYSTITAFDKRALENVL